MGVLFVYIDSQQCISEEDDRAHDICVAASGFVLEPTRILAPVVSVFDSAPMPANHFHPLLWNKLIAWQAAQVVSTYRFTQIDLGPPVAFYDHQCARIREAHGHRLHVQEEDTASLYASMAAFGLVKKGVAFAAAFCA